MKEKKEKIEIKKYSLTIEPMRVGKNVELQDVLTTRIFNKEKETFDEYQGIVSPRSPLGVELRKILKQLKK